MTREELAAIPDREVDVLILEKLMGWKWYVSASSGNRCIFHPDNIPHWFTKEATGTERLVGDFVHLDRPKFSTDHNSAALVRARIKELGLEGEFGDTIGCLVGPSRWATANASPRETCIAAILANGPQQEPNHAD